MPSAQATAAPPLEPPGVRGEVPGVAGDAGQRAVGHRLPAELRRGGLADQHRTLLAQARGRRRVLVPGLVARDRAQPRSVGQPRVRIRSLIVAGTPSSSPCGSPRCQRASEARAAASARSPIDQAEGVDRRLEALDPRRAPPRSPRPATAPSCDTAAAARRRRAPPDRWSSPAPRLHGTSGIRSRRRRRKRRRARGRRLEP